MQGLGININCSGKVKAGPWRKALDPIARKAATVIHCVFGYGLSPIGILVGLVRMGIATGQGMVRDFVIESQDGLYCNCPVCRFRRDEITSTATAKELMSSIEGDLEHLGINVNTATKELAKVLEEAKEQDRIHQDLKGIDAVLNNIGAK